MRFRELPGIPALYADFVEGLPAARPFFPWPPDAGSLLASAGAVLSLSSARSRGDLCDLLLRQAGQLDCSANTLDSIERLREPGTATIMTTVRPELLGGGLYQWLKIFTAARLAAWLSARGTAAVPVIWMESGQRSAETSITVLGHGGIQRLRLDGIDALHEVVPDTITLFFEQVEHALAIRLADSTLLQALRKAYEPGTSWTLAFGRALARIFDAFGLVLCDPLQTGLAVLARNSSPATLQSALPAIRKEHERRLLAAGYGDAVGSSKDGRDERGPLSAGSPFEPTSYVLQDLLFPIAAHVVEEAEATSVALGQAILAGMHLPAPVIWPRASVTLVDARGRKLLARLGLEVAELFEGPKSVLEKLEQRMFQGDAQERIGILKTELVGRIAAIQELVPAESRFHRAVEQGRRRMVYQLDKLNDRVDRSQTTRRSAAARQVHRLCDSLAPFGRLQEREFSGFQFLLRHGDNLLQDLSGRIDPWLLKHQILFVE